MTRLRATSVIALCALSSPAAAQEVAGVFSEGRTHFITYAEVSLTFAF